MEIRDTEIVTPSLRLRRFTLADTPRIGELNAEPTTSRWLPSHVYADAAEAHAAVAYLIAQSESPGNPRLGPYVLAIEDRAGGELLGHVGFSALGDDVEISYAIGEAWRGHGWGAEAITHACKWAAATFGLRCIIAVTASENVASSRTLERAGFALVREETMDFQGMPKQTVRRYTWRAP